MRSDLADVDLRFKFYPKSGKSVAFSDQDPEELSFPPKPPIFLPIHEIEMYPADPKPGSVVRVTMPQWLAEDKGLV